MKWYHWILLVVVVIPVTVLAFVLGRRNGDLASEVSHEMDALESRAEASKWRAELGAEKATAKVKEQHAETMAKLEQEKLDEVERLTGDPVALADLLARLSR